jgi:hypothetical protein
MSFKCVDCRRFIRCEKNSEEWEKAKSLYPVPLEEAVAPGMSENEHARLQYINQVAARCQERVVA